MPSSLARTRAPSCRPPLPGPGWPFALPLLGLVASAALFGSACDGEEPGPQGTLEDNFGVEETEGTDGCDNLLPECLLPYPSEAYVGEDGRLAIPDLDLRARRPFAAASTNRNRGFGAATPIYFQIPGAVAPTVTPFDSEASLDRDYPTTLIDASTGERIPHWVETDYLSPDVDPTLFVIRPAIALPRGAEVVVGITGMLDEAGAPAEAPEGFAAIRDRSASRFIGVHARRAHFEDRVFPVLEAAGIERNAVQLAFSFPIQSAEDATRPLLSVRDAIFDALPEGGPDYEIDDVLVCEGMGADPEGCHPSIRVIVDGRVFVPSVVLPEDDLGVRLLRLDGEGRPVVEGVEAWPFRFQLPHAAFDGDGPVPVMQYGHGFLGGQREANNGWLREMADRFGFAILACDMQGMNEPIAEVWSNVLLTDGGRFPELQELAFQGVVTQLVQQRLVKTTLANDDDARFRRDDGQLAWDSSVVWYYGNSQGGSVGTLVMATTLDVERGVLGVPGSGYPLLLHRSTVFQPFATLIGRTYRATTSVATFLGLLGTGWDNSDPLTFAPHLANPLPGTPSHQALYHVAKEDRQVHNETSFISARAAGGTLMVPAVRPVFLLPETTYPASPDVPVVEVDFGIPDDPTPLDPPDGDPSLPNEGDTHGWLRRYLPGQEHMIHFLRTGEMIDTCGGEPCVHDGPP